MAARPRKQTVTTPEEEGIELYPDSRERFERTFDEVVKAPRLIE